MRTMFKILTATAVVSLMIGATYAQAATLYSAPLRIGDDQYFDINFANVSSKTIVVDWVLLNFGGNAVDSGQVTLGPGESTAHAYVPGVVVVYGEASFDGNQENIRAVLCAQTQIGGSLAPGTPTACVPLN